MLLGLRNISKEREEEKEGDEGEDKSPDPHTTGGGKAEKHGQ